MNLLFPTLKRALWIACLWGVPISSFSTVSRLAASAPQPHIRKLAEIKPFSLARTTQWESGSPEWSGPLPLIAGQEWNGSASQGNLSVTLSDVDWFIPGTTELNRLGQARVREVYDSLMGLPVAKNQMKILIEAHTDSSPVVRLKNKYPTNWELSSARALSVLRELAALGVLPQQLTGVGLADSRPHSVIPALNRRLQLTVRFNPVSMEPYKVAQR